MSTALTVWGGVRYLEEVEIHYDYVDPQKQRFTKEVEAKASKIKLLILDVDGILTDGRI